MNLREVEAESIRKFVQAAADDGCLSGRVLDFGCGRQPYRDIVQAAGGEYHPFDRLYYAGNVSGEDVGDVLIKGYDAILCTQVVQYLDYPRDEIYRWRNLLRRSSGHLVLTYPTNWPEVEQEDLHRFTAAGMKRMLTAAGFEILRHERRAQVLAWNAEYDNAPQMLGDELALGYGVIAVA